MLVLQGKGLAPGGFRRLLGTLAVSVHFSTCYRKLVLSHFASLQATWATHPDPPHPSSSVLASVINYFTAGLLPTILEVCQDSKVIVMLVLNFILALVDSTRIVSGVRGTFLILT